MLLVVYVQFDQKIRTGSARERNEPQRAHEQKHIYCVTNDAFHHRHRMAVLGGKPGKLVYRSGWKCTFSVRDIMAERKGASCNT